MSNEFPELDRTKVTVDEATKDQHMTAISRAIAAELAPRRSRLRLLAVAAGVVLLLPVMALASDQTVPGDFLYPVKQVFEPVVGVFDSHVAATHRVEEVELLYEREAPSDVIHAHVDVARDTIAHDDIELNEHRVLTDRLERVVSDLAERDLAERDLSDHDAPREPVRDDGPAEEPSEEPTDEPADDHTTDHTTDPSTRDR